MTFSRLDGQKPGNTLFSSAVICLLQTGREQAKNVPDVCHNPKGELTWHLYRCAKSWLTLHSFHSAPPVICIYTVDIFTIM